jgi:transcriptional regulator with XRE-family HTH domain
MKRPGLNHTLTAEAESKLKEVGFLLAEARRRRGVSASKLAQRIGVDRRTLAEVEKGNPRASMGVLFQALSALNLLRGIEEVLRPENDVEGISTNIRRLRTRKSPYRSIDDKKVDF